MTAATRLSPLFIIFNAMKKPLNIIVQISKSLQSTRTSYLNVLTFALAKDPPPRRILFQNWLAIATTTTTKKSTKPSASHSRRNRFGLFSRGPAN